MTYPMFNLPQLRVARDPFVVASSEPVTHLRELSLDPTAERRGVLGRAASESRGSRHPVAEDLRAEASRLGGCPRATVERVRQRALRVRERDVDLVGGAAGFDEVAFGLGQLVVAERDRQRPDHRGRDHRDARQRLLRFYPRRQVLLEDLGIDPPVERRLARLDRVRIVLAGPFAKLHERRP
jgi:hypothetical protein